MSEQVSDPIQIPLPLAYLGSVNAWLLQGEPLTLIDSGAANDETVHSLQSQLEDHGVAIEQIELVLLTHHHLDHSGLATMIKDRSGAQIAAHRATAQWGLAFDEHSRADQRFTRELMAANGVPAAVVDSSDDFFARIVADSRPFKTDLVLSDGDRITAGGRTLRVVFRPGHSSTDTLFVMRTPMTRMTDSSAREHNIGCELMPTEPRGDQR